MIELTKEVTLVAKRGGTYTNYVFKDNNSSEYIFCTRLPKWEVPEIDIGDIGYLQYQKVRAGDEYFDPDKQEAIVYKYTNSYFMNFVKKSDTFKNKEIIL